MKIITLTPLILTSNKALLEAADNDAWCECVAGRIARRPHAPQTGTCLAEQCHRGIREWRKRKANANGSRRFLRLATNAKIFLQPTPIADAIAFIDILLAMSGVEIPASGSEWLLRRSLCLEKKLTGNAIPDAWLAAAVYCMAVNIW